MALSDVPFVVTIVARRGSTVLPDSLLAEAALLVGATAPPVWLGAGEAADLAVDAAAVPAFAPRLESWREAHRLDAFVQPRRGRRKALLVADMDSTVIGQECIDELADCAGLKARVSAITERAMRGEIAFEAALRERVALLRGLPETVIDTVLRERITMTPGARTLVATMRRHGAFCAMVSGGFTLFTGPVAAMLGFDEHRGNRLMARNGVLTGHVGAPIIGRAAKRAILVELRDRLGLDRDATLAVGDGANDLAMLDEAGFGVAFRAKPAVAAAAAGRLDYGDLSALLYAQGYDAPAFVS